MQIIASFIYLFISACEIIKNYTGRPDGGIVQGTVAKVYFKNKNKTPDLNANQRMLILLGLQSSRIEQKMHYNKGINGD